MTNRAFLVSHGPRLNDDMYHHVALTMDRHSTNGVRLYVDGQRVLACDATLFSGTFSNRASLEFGAAYGGAASEESLNGLLDELAIYSRSLLPAEVLAIYAAGAAGKCPPAPAIALHRFPPTLHPWAFQVSFAGIPGRAYTLQRAPVIPGPWAPLTILTTDPSDLANYVDSNTPAPGAFGLSQIKASGNLLIDRVVSRRRLAARASHRPSPAFTGSPDTHFCRNKVAVSHKDRNNAKPI